MVEVSESVEMEEVPLPPSQGHSSPPGRGLLDVPDKERKRVIRTLHATVLT